MIRPGRDHAGQWWLVEADEQTGYRVPTEHDARILADAVAFSGGLVVPTDYGLTAEDLPPEFVLQNDGTACGHCARELVPNTDRCAFCG